MVTLNHKGDDTFMCFFVLDWSQGSCRIGLCKGDSACLPGPTENLHRCICPNDKATPVFGEVVCSRRVGKPNNEMNLEVHGRKKINVCININKI